MIDLPQDLPDRSPQPPPDKSPPVPAAVQAVPERGLEPRDQPPKRVVVIGAGLAGLVAAYELKRQGHDVVVIEAQAARHPAAQLPRLDQDPVPGPRAYLGDRGRHLRRRHRH